MLVLVLLACAPAVLIVRWLVGLSSTQSIFDDIGKVFDPVVELGEEVIEGAEAAYHAIAIVWKYLTETARFVTVAWDWVVKGVEWFADQAEALAEETFGAMWHILTQVIPEVAEWVYRHAILWALHQIEGLAKRAWHWVRSAIRWAQREFLKAERFVKHLFHNIIKWAEHAVWWVKHRAEYVWHILTHLPRLAAMLAAHIVEPILKWLFRHGSKIVVRLLRSAAHQGSDVERFVEDVLHDML